MTWVRREVRQKQKLTAGHVIPVGRVAGWQIVRRQTEGGEVEWLTIALDDSGAVTARRSHSSHRAAQGFANVNPRPRGV